jgi:hypothetical protein
MSFGKHDYKIFFYLNGFNGTGTNQSVYIASSDTPFSILYFKPSEEFRLLNESNYYFYSFSVGGGGKYDYEDIYDFSDKTMSLANNYNSAYGGYSHYILLYDTDYSVYSSHDIKDKDNNVVFSGAPVGNRVEPMTIKQVEEIPQAVVEIVKMVLIPCLIIFSVLLVLYLIRSKKLLNL